jgi:hypothetical protein
VQCTVRLASLVGRGILAVQPISDADLREAPLLAVPERLYMTDHQARHMLGLDCQVISPHLQLALLLAHERKKGAASLWAPYISALPGQPAAAWYLPDADRRRSLALLSLPAEDVSLTMQLAPVNNRSQHLINHNEWRHLQQLVDFDYWLIAAATARERMLKAAAVALAKYHSSNSTGSAESTEPRLNIDIDDVLWAAAQVRNKRLQVVKGSGGWL